MITCSNCGHQAETFAYCPACGTKYLGQGGDESSLEGNTLNDKYRVIEKIGQGSMGTVYRGEHIGLKKKVALKVLHSELQVGEETLQRFQREGIALGQIDHPNAIQIFDFDRDGDRIFYLAMEFVEGQNLKAVLREASTLAVGTALKILEQILMALREAHRHGIVHRDLKPDNIMVDTDAAGEPRVKVLDFGLSKLVDLPMEASLATQVGRIMGTPLYMSPEQCSGEPVDLRTDLYAAGLILYEMVAGSAPFAGDSVTEIFSQHLTKPTPSVTASHPNLEVPQDLDPFFQQALAKRREDRFQTAAEMLEAVEALRRGEFVGTGEPAPVSKTPATKSKAQGSKSRTPWFVGALAVAVLAGGGFWLAGEFQPQSDAARVRERSSRTETEERYARHLGEAEQAIAQRDADVAFSALLDAKALISDDSELFYLRARAAELKGDDDAAIVDYQAALELDPMYAAAETGIGWIRLERGELNAAGEHFDSAVSMDPDSAIGLTGQAALALELDELDQAQRLLSVAIDLDPDSSRAHTVTGELRLLRGDVQGAIDAFVRAKRADSRNAAALAGLGAAYLRQGRPGEAEQQFIEALSRDPLAHRARTMLASLLVDSGRFADANREIQKGLQRNPNNRRLRVLSGISKQARGEDTRAIEDLQAAVDSGEANAEVRTLLATLYHKAGQTSRALVEVEAAIAADPNCAAAHVQRGVLLFSEEEFQDAAEALEEGLRLSPGDRFGNYAYGILCMNYLGRRDVALEHLQRYLDAGGPDSRVRGWVRDLQR